MRFSAVNIHVDRQTIGVINANHNACVGVEKTLGLLERGQVVDFGVRKSHHYYPVLSQNIPLAEYLASSQRITISTALSMEALSKRCWVINEMLREQSEEEEQLPSTEVTFHVKRLLECLKNLRMMLEAILE